MLFAATNFGLVTVWHTKTYNCFLNWQADSNELDFLVCIKHRLITGSSRGAIKLWNIQSIHEIKNQTSNKANIRTDGLTIENEIQVNGAVKYCQFDNSCEIGIVATNKNTLFYLNWTEESSVRLVSTHSGKINSICCIDDKYLSTASDDGSVNIWSLKDRERIVQFEVKSVSATCQTLLLFENNKNLQKLVKYIKTASNKTPFILVGYSDGSVRIFDIDRKCIVSKLKPLADAITSINYCKNSKLNSKYAFTKNN
jgi:WD40 repeat protein